MNAENAFETNANQYILAGWLSILHAVIILPKAGMDFLFEITSRTSSDYFQLFFGFHGVGMIIGVYVLLVFRKLLNEQYSFHKADIYIIVLVFFYILSLLLDLAGLFLISIYDVLDANIILFGLSSLITIVYAVKLLKLDNDLSGLLRPYIYTTIAGGICGASLILGQIGNLINMVSLILLGIILIRARSEFEYL